jgi:endonuclease YncB( thermonuclease family)
MIRTLIIAAILAVCAPASAQPVASIDWHDGDSGTIDGVSFRLADVDAPETGGVGSRGGAKCEAERELGAEARAFIVEATEGKALKITSIRAKDDYGRSVVTLSADGRDVGALGLSAGHLRPWVFRGQRATTKKPAWC